MNWLDRQIDGITMYRLVLYALIGYLVLALLLSTAQILPYQLLSLILSTAVLVVASLLTQRLYSRVFQTTSNAESALISALILALIISPQMTLKGYLFLTWAAILMSSLKFIVAWRGKQLFNPVALAVAVTALALNQSASWWIGQQKLLPFVTLGGFILARKLRRFDLVASFLGAALLTLIASGLWQHRELALLLKQMLLDSPLIFFATIMLTEPQTMPQRPAERRLFGALIGVLFTPLLHFGRLYLTPELALLIGNLYAFAVLPKGRFALTLQRVEQVGDQIIDAVFRPSRPLPFRAGQYVELTLPVPKADDRGNRRFLTIASSPTEPELRFGLKIGSQPSRYKQALLEMRPGAPASVATIGGSFTLPKSQAEKCLFIAGGIGITPFRSMAQYLIDQREQRDIILLYSVAKPGELVYGQVFERAAAFGFRTYPTITDRADVPAGWTGQIGLIDRKMLQRLAPDFLTRHCYLSGPHGMVVAFEQLLSQLGVPRRQITVDYFPGFA